MGSLEVHWGSLAHQYSLALIRLTARLNGAYHQPSEALNLTETSGANCATLRHNWNNNFFDSSFPAPSVILFKKHVLKCQSESQFLIFKPKKKYQLLYLSVGNLWLCGIWHLFSLLGNKCTFSPFLSSYHYNVFKQFKLYFYKTKNKKLKKQNTDIMWKGHEHHL